MPYLINHPQPYTGSYNSLVFKDGIAHLDGPLPERSMGDTPEEIAVFLRDHGFTVEEVSADGEPVSVESPIVDPTVVEEVFTDETQAKG